MEAKKYSTNNRKADFGAEVKRKKNFFFEGCRYNGSTDIDAVEDDPAQPHRVELLWYHYYFMHVKRLIDSRSHVSTLTY